MFGLFQDLQGARLVWKFAQRGRSESGSPQTATQEEADPWADEVREAMRHTWRGYKAKAWGRDDLKTVSGKPSDWCRMAVTMIDGLSTLWLMGLKDEFQDAADWLAKQQMPTQERHGMHSFFEITIRVMGGLVSAFELSRQNVFLDTARRLAERMMPAFETPNGMPKNTVDVGTGDSKWVTWTKNALLAEAGTLQMEFGGLSHDTGEPKYGLAADRSMQTILDAAGGRGLVPIYLTRTGTPPRFNSNKISIGAMGDSYYEYLLKHWLQSGKKKTQLKVMLARGPSRSCVTFQLASVGVSKCAVQRRHSDPLVVCLSATLRVARLCTQVRRRGESVVCRDAPRRLHRLSARECAALGAWLERHRIRRRARMSWRT